MGGEGMPFASSKGPLLNLMDARYSASGNNLQERIGILQRLREGWQPGVTMGGTFDVIQHAVDLTRSPANPDQVRSFFLPGVTTSLTVPVALRRHLNRHWFGLEVDDQGNAISRDQDPSKPNTGWWMGWKGDAEAVFREGLIRALEVSLGLQHGEEPAGPSYFPRRAYRLDFEWVCGPPRFEVGVRWRAFRDQPATAADTSGGDDGDGVVIVTFITPPARGLPLSKRFEGEGVVTDPAKINNKVLTQDIGMLIVGQDVEATDVERDYHVDAFGPTKVAALEWRPLGVTGENGHGIEWINDPRTGPDRQPHGVAQLPLPL